MCHIQEKMLDGTTGHSTAAMKFLFVLFKSVNFSALVFFISFQLSHLTPGKTEDEIWLLSKALLLRAYFLFFFFFFEGVTYLALF